MSTNKKRKRNYQFLTDTKTDKVATPKWLYQTLDAEFQFDYDPCPIYWEKERDPDGLKTDWGKRNFVNPPYSSIKVWVKKAVEEKLKGNLSVMLITAKIQSRYWFDLVWPNASEIRFLQGGIKFDGYDHIFPIPLAIVIFDPNSEKPLLYGQLSHCKMNSHEYIKIKTVF